MIEKISWRGVFAHWRRGLPDAVTPDDGVGFSEHEAPKPMRRVSSMAQHLSEDILVIVPCFNTVTYVRAMVGQLKAFGLRNILLVDNASTYSPMLDYLASPDEGVRVAVLTENMGPRRVVLDATNYAMLPDIFCVTDPDLLFNPEMPPDFIAQMIAASHQLKCGKVGLALDIADHDAMIQDDFLIGHPQKIWEHEAKFWTHHVHSLPGGDPVYTADVDTTFAVYNKTYFTPEPIGMFLRGMRVGGRFTCRHRPWYRDNGLQPDEEAFYRATAKDSFYLKPSFAQKTRDE